MELDDILSEVGEYGKYQQLLLWFVFLPAHLPFGSHGYSQIFMSLTPDHWCHVPALAGLNVSDQIKKKLTVPFQREDRTYVKCTVYSVDFSRYKYQLPISWHANTSWPRVPCNSGWDYNRTNLVDDNTIVTEMLNLSVVPLMPAWLTVKSLTAELNDKSEEIKKGKWDLVCDKAWLPLLALSLFQLGEFIGQCLYLIVMQRYGRRPSFFFFLTIQCLVGVLSAFSPDFVSFVIFRLLVGISVPAVSATPDALAQELVGASLRLQAWLLSCLSRTLGVLLLSGVVYLIRDWAHLSLANSLPFIAFFLYWWILPESPKWLLNEGRYEELGRLYRTIAHTNGANLSPDYIINLKRRFRVERAVQDERGPEEPTYSFGDLFKTPNLCKKTIIISFVRVTNTAVCVGLTYYSIEVEGDVYLNFFLAVLADLLGLIVALTMLRRYGRRCSVFLCSAVGSTLCLILSTGKCSTKTSQVLFVVAKTTISSSCIILPLWSSELLPAVVRDVGQNVLEVLCYLSPVVVPLLIYQKRKRLGFPLVILGSMELCGALGSLLLPEPYTSQLPQTLEDGEEYGKHWGWKDCFRCQLPKMDNKNGLSKPSKQVPQSPILSLLRRHDALQATNSSEGETESQSDQSGIKTVMVTVL